jgi:hypothetical protein
MPPLLIVIIIIISGIRGLWFRAIKRAGKCSLVEGFPAHPPHLTPNSYITNTKEHYNAILAFFRGQIALLKIFLVQIIHKIDGGYHI